MLRLDRPPKFRHCLDRDTFIDTQGFFYNLRELVVARPICGECRVLIAFLKFVGGLLIPESSPNQPILFHGSQQIVIDRGELKYLAPRTNIVIPLAIICMRLAAIFCNAAPRSVVIFMNCEDGFPSLRYFVSHSAVIEAHPERQQVGREQTGCLFIRSGTAAPARGAALSGLKWWKADLRMLSWRMLTKVSMAVIATVSFAAACSSEPRQVASSSPAGQGRSTILGATLACKHLKKDEKRAAAPSVGISAYEVCLGEQANLTRPANPQLCALAKSVMSPAGICILGE